MQTLKIYVTGRGGFVGRHVTDAIMDSKHALVGNLGAAPDAIIHLAWAGLPNYDSAEHYQNIAWQYDLLKTAAESGVQNITVAGTCLELAPRPPHYALAKIALRAKLEALQIRLKWVRLPYLYGDGQRPECLLPQLRAAVARGDKTFRVIAGSRDFMDVRAAAKFLVYRAELDSGSCAVDCRGNYERVADFCRRHVPQAIEIAEDYPLPPWET